MAKWSCGVARHAQMSPPWYRLGVASVTVIDTRRVVQQRVLWRASSGSKEGQWEGDGCVFEIDGSGVADVSRISGTLQQGRPSYAARPGCVDACGGRSRGRASDELLASGSWSKGCRRICVGCRSRSKQALAGCRNR
jgi:hypothetical protein